MTPKTTTVPQAVRFLITCFTGQPGADARALREALGLLGELVEIEISRIRDVSAFVLLEGFEILTEHGDRRNVVKMRMMRDNLRLLVEGEELPLISPAAVVALWAEVIALSAREATRHPPGAGQRRWMATAQAWAGGLQTIFFRTKRTAADIPERGA
jgi:hypothetical protein